MSRLSRLLSIGCAAVVLLALTACPQPDPPREVIVPPTTKVADTATLAALTAFDSAAGQLRFASTTSRLAELELGDVLVAPPSENAPYGFLRKVTEIRDEAGELVIETVPASLIDAVSQGEIDVEGELGPGDLAESVAHIAGVTGQALRQTAVTRGGEAGSEVQSTGYDFEVSFDVQLAYEGEEDGTTVKGKVRAQGLVRFNVGYGFGFGAEPCVAIPPVCVDRFEARAGISQYTDIRLSANLDGKVLKEQKLNTFFFQPILIWLGPVPVVLLPVVDVLVGVHGEAKAAFSFRAMESVQLQVGAKWTDPNDGGRGWENLSQNNGISHSIPTPSFEATMVLRGYGKTDAKLLIYGAAGPTMSASLGAGGDAQYPRRPLWKIFGHLSARVAFELDIFGVIDLALYEDELFTFEPVLLESMNAAPRFSNVVSGTIQVDLGVPTNLGPRAGFGGYFDVMDPEGDPIQLTAVSNVDGPINLTATFATSGPRRITVTAKDPAGATSNITLKLEVNNSLPFLNVQVASHTVPVGVQFVVTAAAYDVETGDLPCSRITYQVYAPDTAIPGSTSGGVCLATVVFAQQGNRLLTVTATDPHGGSTTTLVEVTVTPPPPNRPPAIDPASYSVRAFRGPIRLPCDPGFPCDDFEPCVTGFWCEVPSTAYINNGTAGSGDYYPPLLLSVDVTDPDGDPLTVQWSCVTGPNNPPVTNNGDGTFECIPIPHVNYSTIAITVQVSDGHNPPVKMTGIYNTLQGPLH